MAKRKPNLKQCKASGCEEMFEPRNMQHQCHHWSCAMAYAKELKEKRAAKAKRQAKKEFNENDTKWLTGKAQEAFNKYIRKRDERLPCVSCGYEFDYLEGEPQGEGRQRQAGHLKTEAKNALLRFDEDNVHAQCNHCNDPFYGLKGNVAEYEKNLRVRIGDERVDRLFQPKVIKKWTVDELKEIIDTYKSKIKGLDE